MHESLKKEKTESVSPVLLGETAQPKKKPEPYYQDEGFELYLTDCIDFLNKFPEESVDMIFADPPYNLSNGGFTCHAGKRVSVHKGDWDVSRGIEKDFEFHMEWIDACRRVLKETGGGF